MRNIPPEIIDENIEAIEEGKPLTLPLKILNGQFKQKAMKKLNRVKLRKYNREWKRKNRDKIKEYYKKKKCKIGKLKELAKEQKEKKNKKEYELLRIYQEDYEKALQDEKSKEEYKLKYLQNYKWKKTKLSRKNELRKKAIKVTYEKRGRGLP